MSRTLLVIPHYQDTWRLAPFLDELLKTLPLHFSILVSDDGSGVEEVDRLCSLIKEKQTFASLGGPKLLDPLLHEPNTGKGGAVIRGWERGEGFSLLSFADADGAVSAREVVRAEHFMRNSSEEPDALFGSRVKMLGRTIRRNLVRHLSGRVFATIASNVAGLSAYDTQCGLKIITPEAFQRIRPCMKTLGFAFDVELCLLLIKYGFIPREFPIDWEDVPGSKVSLLRDSTRMAIEVFRIRRRVASIAQ